MRPFHAIVATLAIVGMISCKGESSLPDRGDFAAIMAEARGDEPVSKRKDSEVRRAVRMSFRTVLYLDSVHTAELAHRWRRPHLSTSYFLRDESFVGRTFPLEIAKLLRESQAATREYLDGLRAYPEILRDGLSSTDLPQRQIDDLVLAIADTLLASRRGMMQYFEAADRFFGAAADLYDVATRYHTSFVAARAGLEIDNDNALHRFNALVPEVNRAAEAANAALQRLSDEEKGRLYSIGLATLAARKSGL